MVAMKEIPRATQIQGTVRRVGTEMLAKFKFPDGVITELVVGSVKLTGSEYQQARTEIAKQFPIGIENRSIVPD